MITRAVLAALVACSAPAPSVRPTPPSRDGGLDAPVRPLASAVHVREIARAEVGLDGALPVHGIVVVTQNLAEGRRITIDADAATIASESHGVAMTKVRTSQHALTAAEVAHVMALARAAHVERPHGDVAQYASDSYERLVLLDGDAPAFEIVGNPISTSDQTDRPAASDAIMAVYALTPRPSAR